MSSRRVNLISHLTVPYFGGMESHAKEFHRHFIERDKRGRFLVMFPNGGPNGGNLTELDIQGTAEEIGIDSTHSFSTFRSSLLEEDFDSVFFFNSLYWIPIFHELKEFFPKAKIFLRSGGNDIIQSQILELGKTLAERQESVVRAINKSVDRLIVNSQYSKARFEDLGIKTNLMRVMVGGVDTSRFYPAAEEEKAALRSSLGIDKGATIIFSAVRFVKFKAVPITIAAALRAARNENLVLILAGDGPEKQTLLDLIRGKPTIKYVGQLNFSEIQNYYRASDIYLQNPIESQTEVAGGSYIHTETMGRTFCEAASSGIPSLCTNVGGVSEVIDDNRTGVLVDIADEALIADKLSYLARNIAFRKRLGENARKKAVTEFDWKKIFCMYEEEFQ